MATLVSVAAIAGRNGDTSIQTSGVSSSLTHRYRVRFAEKTATGDEAMTAAGVPAYFSAIGGKLLLSKSAEQDPEDPRVWIVTCSYQIPQGQNQQTPPTEGDKKSIKITGTSSPYEIETMRDRTGKLIANRAGDAFTPPYNFTFNDEKITVTYDATAPDWDTITTYCGWVNEEPVTLTIYGTERTFIRGQMKYDSYQWSGTIDQDGTQKLQITLNFIIRHINPYIKPGSTDDPDDDWYPWALTLDNVGLREKRADGKLYPIIMPNDPNNTPVSTPWGLDLDGKKLAAGASLHQVFFDTENFHDFNLSLLADIST